MLRVEDSNLTTRNVKPNARRVSCDPRACTKCGLLPNPGYRWTSYFGLGIGYCCPWCMGEPWDEHRNGPRP